MFVAARSAKALEKNEIGKNARECLVTACRLLNDVNIIGQLDSEAAAIPHNVAPLVAKVGNNVIAFK